MKKIIYFLLIVVMVMLNSCGTSNYYNLPPKEFKEIDYTFDIKYQKVRNINIAYIDEGKSEKVILLIHGLGTSAKSWIKNIPDLELLQLIYRDMESQIKVTTNIQCRGMHECLLNC